MISYRRLSPSDVPLARELVDMLTPESRSELPGREYLARILTQPGFHAIVALDGDRVIGGVTGFELQMYKRQETEMLLYEIGVRVAYQSRGIGSQLLVELQQVCREREISHMFVLTSRDNVPANRLYHRCGGLPSDSMMYTFRL